jgi:hypothetical protein
VDITGWARMVAADLQPPATHADLTAYDHPDDEADADDDPVALSPELPAALLKEIPSKTEEYGRWHQLWTLIRDDAAGNTTLADRHGVSQRTLQRIRKAGELGLLDSPIPLIARLLPQARKVASRANGHQPETPNDTAQ